MRNEKTSITKWDVSNHINTLEDSVTYLNTAFDDGDDKLILVVLGDIVRAKGIEEVTNITGLSREVLNRAFFTEGKPEFSIILKIIIALGIKLQVTTCNKNNNSI